jgi:hypothetical protein
MLGFIFGTATGVGATLAVQEWGMPSAGWVVAGIAVTCLVTVVSVLGHATDRMFG